MIRARIWMMLVVTAGFMAVAAPASADECLPALESCARDAGESQDQIIACYRQATECLQDDRAACLRDCIDFRKDGVKRCVGDTQRGPVRQRRDRLCRQAQDLVVPSCRDVCR
jgi:hypothetical protein